MAIDPEYGEKVSFIEFRFCMNLQESFTIQKESRYCGKGHSVVSEKMLILIDGDKSIGNMYM